MAALNAGMNRPPEGLPEGVSDPFGLVSEEVERNWLMPRRRH